MQAAGQERKSAESLWTECFIMPHKRESFAFRQPGPTPEGPRAPCIIVINLPFTSVFSFALKITRTDRFLRSRRCLPRSIPLSELSPLGDVKNRFRVPDSFPSRLRPLLGKIFPWILNSFFPSYPQPVRGLPPSHCSAPTSEGVLARKKKFNPFPLIRLFLFPIGVSSVRDREGGPPFPRAEKNNAFIKILSQSIFPYTSEMWNGRRIRRLRPKRLSPQAEITSSSRESLPYHQKSRNLSVLQKRNAVPNPFAENV